MPIIRRVVKLVGSGIGAARESYINHQEDRARAAGESSQAGSSRAPPPPQQGLPHETPEGQPPPYIETTESHAQELIKSGKAVPVDEGESESDDDAELEEQWRLDEAAEAIDPPSYEESEAGDAENTEHKDLVAAVLTMAPPAKTRKSPLPVPVVLPQRRPRSKGRGFIRAYPPLLNDCAIDQRTFLTFLKNFHKSSQASKGLKVVFLAAGVVGFVPEVAAQIVSTVVQVGVGTAIELQSRYRANAFLNEMNEKLFRPRGLFALVVAYKPDQKKRFEVGDFDPASSIARYTQPAEQGWKNTARNLRTSSGKNYGALDIGEVAPLMYPSIEDAKMGETEKQKNAWKKFGQFMQDYGDRRAQAEYAHQNPQEAALSGPPVEFKSRYSDPNHPANSGSIISLITGGHINPMERKDRRRQQKREFRAQITGRPVRKPGEGGFIKRALTEDVAYLMIVNMPSEQELEAARTKLAAQQSH